MKKFIKYKPFFLLFILLTGSTPNIRSQDDWKTYLKEKYNNSSTWIYNNKVKIAAGTILGASVFAHLYLLKKSIDNCNDNNRTIIDLLLLSTNIQSNLLRIKAENSVAKGYRLY